MGRVGVEIRVLVTKLSTQQGDQALVSEGLLVRLCVCLPDVMW